MTVGKMAEGHPMRAADRAGQGHASAAARVPGTINTPLAAKDRHTLERYRRDGFVLVRDLFAPTEIDALRERLAIVCAEGREGRVLERDGSTVRSVYGCHRSDPVFGGLTRDKRIVRLVQQIIGGPVYIYQFKINLKHGFLGDLWKWHDDFVYWAEEDGVGRPDLTSVAVFLDEVSEWNGPMVFVPGSHRERSVEVQMSSGTPAGYEQDPAWIANLTADIKYSVPQAELVRLVNARGLRAPKGPAGSVLLFHPQVVHASATNISPFGRALALITYNSVANIPQPVHRQLRPEFLCARDFAAVEPDSI